MRLSDSPVTTSNGLNKADSFVVVPTGPTQFFIAVNDRRTADAFVAQDERGRLERAFNDAVVRQAESLVIGATSRHRAFIEKRLGRAGGDRTRAYWSA